MLEEGIAHPSQNVHLCEQQSDRDGNSDSILSAFSGNDGISGSHNGTGQIVRNRGAAVGCNTQGHQLQSSADRQSCLQIS